MSDEPVDLVPIPPLITLLLAQERQKMQEIGEPLTEAEVLEVRDNAVCMTMSRSRHLQLIESRGYHDVDTENVWMDWQQAREELKDLD